MLALVAGEGALLGILVAALEVDRTPFQLCEIEGHKSDVQGDRSVINFRVERLGSFIEHLKNFGATEVCFAGRVARPKLDPTLIDAATMPLVPRMMTALQSGDDAALRIVLEFFEEAGFVVRAAHELVPDLLPQSGVLTEQQPSDQNRRDAGRGHDIIAAMSSVDLGQSCIVANGQALAVEALPGTDWMLRSLLVKQSAVTAGATAENPFEDPIGWAADWLTGDPMPAQTMRDPTLPAGGILFKAAKLGQDRRVDLPAIGPNTIKAAKLAALDGVVIEAGGVMVLHLERTISLANKLDLFLWVRE